MSLADDLREFEELGDMLDGIKFRGRFVGKDEHSFLRAIFANLADHLPRRIYADWLDEHGFVEDAEFWRAYDGSAFAMPRLTKISKVVAF